MRLLMTARAVVGSSRWLHPRVRMACLRRLGVGLGEGTFLSPPALFRGDRVVSGPGCYFNSGVFVGRGPLTLGAGVFVGPGVMFITDTHELGPPSRRAGKDVEQPIVIEDGVWIGGGAVILGNVRVAAGCVVGAGAVVTTDTEPNGLYVGVPARRIRDLPL